MPAKNEHASRRLEPPELPFPCDMSGFTGIITAKTAGDVFATLQGSGDTPRTVFVERSVADLFNLGLPKMSVVALIAYKISDWFRDEGHTILDGDNQSVLVTLSGNVSFRAGVFDGRKLVVYEDMAEREAYGTPSRAE